MPEGGKLRGAAPVNDEFEVGYNSAFERRWRVVEITGRAVMGLVVLAGLSGLLGRGPLSHHTVATAGGAIRVDFEPVARWDTPTQVTLHLVPPPDGAATMQVRLSPSFAEPLGMQKIWPRPLAEAPDHRGLSLTLAVPRAPGEFLVRLDLLPTAVGPVGAFAETDAGGHLGWTQVILP